MLIPITLVPSLEHHFEGHPENPGRFAHFQRLENLPCFFSRVPGICRGYNEALSLSLPDGFRAAWTGAIAASNSQDVVVSFSPLQAWNYEGNLMVNSDYTSGTNTWLLFGTGLAVAPLLSIESPNPDVILTMRGIVGGQYGILCAPGLDETNTWLNLTNTTLTTSSFAFTDWTFTNSPRRFYRGIVVRPAP